MNDWYHACHDLSIRSVRQIHQTYPLIKLLWHDDFNFPLYSTSDDFVILDDGDLERIEQAYPWDGEKGREVQLEELQASFNFLSLCRKRKSWTPIRTTYGFKHDVESVSGIYVREISFVRAASLAGFALKQIGGNGGFHLNVLCDPVYFYLLDVLSHSRLTKSQFGVETISEADTASSA
jgi:hypothetical protein